MQFHPLKVAEVQSETEDAVVVRFEVPLELEAAFAFVQGQHLTLRQVLDGEELRRSYSICEAVGSGRLRVAIKKVAGGRFSTFANTALKVGDLLEVAPPTGSFHTQLSPEQARTYAAFAAGSGITPVLSIIKTTLAKEPASRFILFYGNREVASILFKEELEDLKDRYMERFSLVHVLSREEQDTPLLNGRIDGDKAEALCRAFCPIERLDEVFLCGPGAMIEAVKERLLGLGLPAARIHFELFTLDPEMAQGAIAGGPQAGEGAPPAQDAAAAEVTVVLDGVRSSFAFPGGDISVLDAATEEGLDLPFSCKSGVCSTCRAKVIEGAAEMTVNFALDPDEVAAGFVLTCQARPRSERLVLDFDEV